MMNITKTRIIKKYPNRRLYDTSLSCYVTLSEVEQLVLNHIPFQVIDAKTAQDMTNYVLLQIISEQESGNRPIFTTELLQNIIRFYGNSTQHILSQYLEKSIDLFAKQQIQLQEHIKQLMATNPLNIVSELTKYNLELLQTHVNSFFSASPKSSEDT